MSYGGGPTLGGGLTVSGSGGGAGSASNYVNLLAPSNPCPNGGSCDASNAQGSGYVGQDPGVSDQKAYASSKGAIGSGGSYATASVRRGSGDGTMWIDKMGHSSAMGDMHIDSLGEGCACPPDPATSPEPVPGPSAQFSIDVLVSEDTSMLASGLMVTCTQTGVSQVCFCSSIKFFLNTFGTYNFTTPGGPGNQCATPFLGFMYSSGSNSGLDGHLVVIQVHHV